MVAMVADVVGSGGGGGITVAVAGVTWNIAAACASC